MLTFRSKTKYRRFSNDFRINKKVNNFHPENINFHVVSFISLVLIMNLSNRYGKWILFAYGLFFTIVTTLFYFKKYKNFLCHGLKRFKRRIIQYSGLWKEICQLMYRQMEKIEYKFLKLNHIGTTLSQIVFFTICEIILLPEQHVTALYSLMFYNVLSYCIAYTRQMAEATNWSPYVNVANHSNIKHLAMSTTKIVLEVTKAVTFVVTIVFVLFVLCLEQRLHYFQPTRLFTLFTATYYLATEKIFADVFPSLLAYLRVSCLDNLEILWAPVILSCAAQILSFIFAFIALWHGAYRAAFITFYLNVYLHYKKLVNGSLKTLDEDKAMVSIFRFATKTELDDYEDVCAVCLNDMRIARVTPCHHIFHTDCLRMCLLNCDRCPVCKRELKFS